MLLSFICLLSKKLNVVIVDVYMNDKLDGVSFGNIANISFVFCEITTISFNENIFLTGRNK